MTDIVQRLWGFCYMLCHDDGEYGDSIEWIPYRLFLEMAEAHARLGRVRARPVDNMPSILTVSTFRRC